MTKAVTMDQTKRKASQGKGALSWQLTMQVLVAHIAMNGIERFMGESLQQAGGRQVASMNDHLTVIKTVSYFLFEQAVHLGEVCIG